MNLVGKVIKFKLALPKGNGIDFKSQNGNVVVRTSFFMPF
jgi:hypothetical protein